MLAVLLGSKQQLLQRLCEENPPEEEANRNQVRSFSTLARSDRAQSLNFLAQVTPTLTTVSDTTSRRWARTSVTSRESQC